MVVYAYGEKGCDGSDCSGGIYWIIISLSFMEVIYFVVDFVIYTKTTSVSDRLEVQEYFHPEVYKPQTRIKCKNVQYTNLPNTKESQ
eukprot:UN11464